MQPNYDDYSYKELKEALQSIDKAAYPERTAELEYRVDNWFETKSIKAKMHDHSLFKGVSYFVAGAVGTGYLFSIEHFDILTDDIHILLSPFLLIGAPIVYWYYNNKYKCHHADIFCIDKSGVIYEGKGESASLVWSEFEQVTYSSLRENPTFFFAKQQSYPNIAVKPSDFNLDAYELKELVSYHCEKHGIALTKIGGFGKEQIVLPSSNESANDK